MGIDGPQIMRPTLLLALLLAVAGTNHAGARASSSQSVIAVAWPAPVGHFQPRASDIPLSPALADREVRDLALDEKLKICRGC